MAKDTSPNSYGLRAKSTPEGFVATGSDGEVWVCVGTGSSARWVRTPAVPFLDDEGKPTTPSPRGRKKSLQQLSAAALDTGDYDEVETSRRGGVQTESGLLWMGDPLRLFAFAKAHTLEQFANLVSKKEKRKSMFDVAGGVAMTGVAVGRNNPVFAAKKRRREGDSVEKMCIIVESHR
jgi:hypothetical protein